MECWPRVINGYRKMSYWLTENASQQHEICELESWKSYPYEFLLHHKTSTERTSILKIQVLNSTYFILINQYFLKSQEEVLCNIILGTCILDLYYNGTSNKVKKTLNELHWLHDIRESYFTSMTINQPHQIKEWIWRYLWPHHGYANLYSAKNCSLYYSLTKNPHKNNTIVNLTSSSTTHRIER